MEHLSLRLRRGMAWALCIGWMAFIFLMSAMPGDVSGAQSGTVVRILLALHDALFGHAELSPQALSLLETLVRKGAHMAEYLVLAALLTGSLRNRDRTGRGLCAGVLSASLFCALIDETIQLFVEGRAGKVSDIWVDLGGAALGLLLALAAGVLWRKKRYVA